MLFTQLVRKSAATAAVFATLISGMPANAEGSSGSSFAKDPPVQARAGRRADKPILIAQAACASCGAEALDPIVLMAADKHKGNSASVLTDSLWGNLILELAYQRDPELQKIARRLKLVNLGTTLAISGIAGGTLAQGISALYVINPPAGVPDSYAPLELGVALSSATILAFIARTYCNHNLEHHIVLRQLEIKARVESVLSHMEHCQAACPEARKQLIELVGERACREWVQLWQSSHQVAMSVPPSVTLNRREARTIGAAELCSQLR